MMWILEHSKIEGNDRANTEAKKAALDSALTQTHRHRPLKSGCVKHIKTAAKERWHKNWENAKTAKTLRHIMRRKSKGIKNGSSPYNEIVNRNTATKIAQLRTSHYELKLYRHRFGLTGWPYRKYGYGKENVEHYLLEYRTHKRAKEKAASECRHRKNENENFARGSEDDSTQWHLLRQHVD